MRLTKIPRILKNVAANATTTGLMTGFQLLSVPIFLRYWGVTLYGEWIAINTLSSYFQTADIGLGTATSNSLVVCYATGDEKRFNTLITNNILFINVVFGLLLIVLTAAIDTGASTSILKTSVLTPRAVSMSLLLLMGQIFIGTITNVFGGIYRATGAISRGIMIDNAIRAGEYGVLVAGAATHLRVPAILALGLSVKLTGLYLKHRDTKKLVDYHISISYVDLPELRNMWVPAISFFTFPIANAIALQGPVLLINYSLGSIAVVAYTTIRTLANCGKALIDILQRSIWPEISIAFSHKNMAALKRLHRRGVQAATLAACSISLVLLLGGKSAYLYWTGRNVMWNESLFRLFLIALVSNSLWTTSGVVLQSTNNHEGLAALNLIAAIGSLCASAIILAATRSITWLPCALVLSDIILATYVFKRALAITHDTLGAWIGYQGAGH